MQRLDLDRRAITERSMPAPPVVDHVNSKERNSYLLAGGEQAMVRELILEGREELSATAVSKPLPLPLVLDTRAGAPLRPRNPGWPSLCSTKGPSDERSEL